MRIPDSIIDQQDSVVRGLFRHWQDYMERNVDFWDIPGDLDIHTQGHCERVLMHALRIGFLRKASPRQLLALSHASIFHDTRRKDNYLDTGHGKRAAEYYKEYCAAGTSGVEFLPEAYVAIWFHDLHDELGEEHIRAHAGDDAEGWAEVYHIFKDADALDRLRLGKWCLDPWFLRTRQALSMMSFAQQLVEATIPPDELLRTYKLTDPFRLRM